MAGCVWRSTTAGWMEEAAVRMPSAPTSDLDRSAANRVTSTTLLIDVLNTGTYLLDGSYFCILFGQNST